MKTQYKKSERIVTRVFQDVFDKYDLMNDLMSLGIHRLWKKKFVNWLNPQKNTLLLDVASGTGDIAKIFLKKVDYKSFVFCVDENKNMLNLNKKRLQANNNIKWFCENAEKLPFKNDYFDYYTISFGIRNINNINNALDEAYRVLKPGGRFLCLEFSKVQNVYFDNLYKKYNKLIPYIGKMIVGEKEPYEYLIKSIEKFINQDELIELMKKNYFVKCEYRNLSGGIVAIHSGWKI